VQRGRLRSPRAASVRPSLSYFHISPSSHSYGKNNDLKVPFWSTKDAGQSEFPRLRCARGIE